MNPPSTSPSRPGGARRVPSATGRWIFVILAVLAASLFVRLGIWQLHRLGERRSQNAFRRARLAAPALKLTPTPGRGAASVPALPTADSISWRHVSLRGRYDFAREILLPGRSYQGQPGVYVLTPFRAHGGLAVLLLRGWIPAPDGIHAPLQAARPSAPTTEEETEVEGIVLPGAGPRPSILGVFRPSPEGLPPQQVIDGESHFLMSRADLEIASSILHYSIATFYVMVTDTGTAWGPIRRIPIPELTNGPHLSYAIQWFAFALVALGGSLAYLRKRG